MMNERLIHLRIKIKSLAAEATIIRQEANKTKGMVKWGLNQHRTEVVRKHSRDNLLAYGLLRGIPYQAIELKCDKAPDFKHVAEIAIRFGGNGVDISIWIYKAVAYLKQANIPVISVPPPTPVTTATNGSAQKTGLLQKLKQACGK